jgi:hypothetical protein
VVRFWAALAWRLQNHLNPHLEREVFALSSPRVNVEHSIPTESINLPGLGPAEREKNIKDIALSQYNDVVVGTEMVLRHHR